MGAVYKARQLKLDRWVALKLLPPETASDPAFAERFGREARALARLNHPNIVTVHDFGQAGGLSYFIMEFVDGVSLRQRLRSAPIPPQETLRIVAQACEALQYAHEEGIAHRDIKPDNILLDRRGRVKIADFGLAKLLARKAVDYTLTGPWQVMGTPHYMAPEQMDNPLAVDHRADVYSLGIVFYEMLTGELPLGRFALPSHKGPVDARLDAVVMRALEREPGRRYQQVSELRAVLDSLADPTVPRPASAHTTPTAPAGSALKAEAAPSAPRPIAVLILAACCLIVWPVGLVLLVLASVWLWFVLRRPDGPAALRRHVSAAECRLRSAAEHSLVPVFGTTTGWSLLFCLLGVAATFQPFVPVAELQVPDVRKNGVPIAQVFGHESPFAITAGGIFLSLFLLLIATGFIEPIPLWRSVLIILAGTGVVGVMGLGIWDSGLTGSPWFSGHWGEYGCRVLGKSLAVNYTLPSGEFQVSGRMTTVNLPGGAGLPPGLTRVVIGFPAYAILAVGLVLILVGTVQLRGVFRRRVRERNGWKRPVEITRAAVPGE
jgi:hypothetical protein